MVLPVGLEPATFWSVARRSIQLSYGSIFLHLDFHSKCFNIHPKGKNANKIKKFSDRKF